MKILLDTNVLLCFQWNSSRLSSSVKDIIESANLPFIHRDPFDRLIFAQSLVEDMQLLSLDDIFDEYRLKMNI